MPVQLPLEPSIANYDVSTTLDGSLYKLDVHWNPRDSSWYFNISDQFGTLIWGDIRIVLGCILGSTCTDPRFPPGILLAVDTTRSNLDASFADLGTRVVVIYYTAAELGLA